MNVENKELISLYDSADFLLHTSMAEGFPLVAQEALTRGCLIIAYSDVVNTVIPNEFIFPLENKILLKKTLNKFFKNRDLLFDHKLKAKDYAYSNFKEEIFFKKFNEIIES